MKGRKKTTWLAMISVVLASAVAVEAQSTNASGYPNGQAPPQPTQISPGAVNYVEGAAFLNGESLSNQSVGSTVLRPGETLTTQNGYAELLLTAGAFLRVGNNSELQIPTAGLASAQVDLHRGSAMVEVDQLINGTNLTIVMNGVSARVDKPGLYGFDATNQTVETFDGKLAVSQNGKTVDLDKHGQLQLTSDKPLKRRSFDEKQAEVEPLYVWSKARSADESQASMQSAQNASEYTGAGPGWYWDPYYGGYGFWPLDAALYSPFGWGFYSPAYFGFGYGFYGGGWGYYRPGGYWGGGRYWNGHGWHGRPPGVAARAGYAGRVGRPAAPAAHFSGRAGGFGGGHFGGGFGGGGHFGGGGGHR